MAHPPQTLTSLFAALLYALMTQDKGEVEMEMRIHNVQEGKNIIKTKNPFNVGSLLYNPRPPC